MNPIHLVAASYGRQTEQLEQLRRTLPADVRLTILDSALHDMATLARKTETEQNVDVFIASGGNAEFLKSCVRAPVVRMAATNSDLLRAISQALQYRKRVCVMSYGSPLPGVDIINSLVDSDIHGRTYLDHEDLLAQLREEYDDGVRDVVGGSLAVKCAEQAGMRGYNLLTIDGISLAVSSAIELARANRQEKEISRRLASILNFTREGIIATNQNCEIVEFNPSAEKLTGMSRESVLGKKVTDVIPNSRLDIVTQQNLKELNAIQDLGPVRILTNRVPITSDGEVIGALATFQSIDVVQDADENIRRGLLKKGFTAKATFRDILGTSEKLRLAKESAERYARTNSTVLITGESGTGKELFAQSIHNASPRAAKPFVALNCATLSHALLESELFGYAGGAFTGARKDGKRGLFELANGGTIFLDEIGDVDLDIQAKLLRVLEAREIMRVGGEELHPVDVRIIAATNKDLWRMTQEETFRLDLFYRLNILELNIPPLRERTSDIPPLLTHYLHRYCAELDERSIERLVRSEAVTAYPWPGNGRELRSVAERFSILYGESGISSIEDLLTHYKADDAPARKPEHETGPLDRDAIWRAIRDCGGNRTLAAKRLGISRTTLWRKLGGESG